MQKVDYSVPFYPNTSDNTHCFQAAIRMVLKYFVPKRNFTWKELEKMTAKVDGLWTWPIAGLVWMQENGFDVIDLEIFDYKEFSEKGERYLIDMFGEGVGQEQIKHSDISQEMRLAKKLLKKKIFKMALPSTQTIKEYLDKGYLVICNVNSRKLNNKEDYAGHFVVMKGYDNNGFTLHDPGLPGQENRFVKFKDFEKAWAFPNEKAKNLMAFRFV